MNLKTEKEIDGHLRKLGSITAPDDLEVDLIPMIWERAARAPRPVLPVLSPQVALCSALILGVFGVWLYQSAILKPSASQVLESVVPIDAVVLDAKGSSAIRPGMTLSEGGTLVTQAGESVTFFFPGAGYLHLDENSQMTLGKSHKQWPGGKTRYEVELHHGKLYSRLDELDDKTRFDYTTSLGQARVIGTDFLLSVKKETTMGVEVLKGVVEVGARNASEEPKYIKEGLAALITRDLPSNLFISDLSDSHKQTLKQNFENYFGRVEGEHQVANDQAENDDAQKFRIVLRREEEKVRNR